MAQEKPEIVEVKENPMSAEFLEGKLKRFRQVMPWIHDIMDSVSHTIRCLEYDLEKIEQEDKEANEVQKNA